MCIFSDVCAVRAKCNGLSIMSDSYQGIRTNIFVVNYLHNNDVFSCKLSSYVQSRIRLFFISIENRIYMN